MTDDEIKREKQYRYDERIAIICEKGPVTREAKEIAQREADEWEFLIRFPSEK
jgi:hypothetical protein